MTQNVFEHKKKYILNWTELNSEFAKSLLRSFQKSLTSTSVGTYKLDQHVCWTCNPKQKWYYVDNNDITQGPVTVQHMRIAFQEKKLLTESLVWNSAVLSKWTALNIVPNLFKELNKPETNQELYKVKCYWTGLRVVKKKNRDVSYSEIFNDCFQSGHRDFWQKIFMMVTIRIFGLNMKLMLRWQ